MKRFLILAIPVLVSFGCGAPEEESPAVRATPVPSQEQLQVARDEAQWQALYDRIMKDYTAKMIPKKLREADVEAARAAAEKDLSDLESAILPPRYGRVNRALLDGFRSLHSGHLYLQMGLQAKDNNILESGRKEMRAAAASFNEAKTWMQKVMPKPAEASERTPE